MELGSLTRNLTNNIKVTTAQSDGQRIPIEKPTPLLYKPTNVVNRRVNLSVNDITFVHHDCYDCYDFCEPDYCHTRLVQISNMDPNLFL